MVSITATEKDTCHRGYLHLFGFVVTAYHTLGNYKRHSFDSSNKIQEAEKFKIKGPVSGEVFLIKREME